jgi:hypothetical protein
LTLSFPVLFSCGIAAGAAYNFTKKDFNLFFVLITRRSISTVRIKYILQYGLTMGKMILFEEDTIHTLVQTRDLLEEILETLDIMADEESMKKISMAEEDVKKGRTRDFDEFLGEMNEV